MNEAGVFPVNPLDNVIVAPGGSDSTTSVSFVPLVMVVHPIKRNVDARMI